MNRRKIDRIMFFAIFVLGAMVVFCMTSNEQKVEYRKMMDTFYETVFPNSKE